MSNVVDFCHYKKTKEVKFIALEQPQTEVADYQVCINCGNELFLMVNTEKGLVPICWMCEANKGNL